MKAKNHKKSWAFLVVAAAFAGEASAQATTSGSSVEQLEKIEVTASSDASAGGLKVPYAGGQVARGGRVGLFGSLDMMETPFTQTSYTQKLITDQQAASIGDVLQNSPAVRVARGFGNFQQTYIVRGLPIYSDDMSYNGLYGLLPRQYLATEFVERVEVLSGASAFLNGAAPGGSGIGGAINIMPKRAPNEALTDITAGLSSGGQNYVAADVARRFADRAAGIRVNVARREGGTSVSDERVQLEVAGIGFDFRGDRFRLSADIGYQNHRLRATQPSVTIASGLDIPSAPKAARNLGQPWTFSNERDTFGTLRGEYDITSNVTAWAAAGTRNGNESASFANPTVTAANGDMNMYRFDNTREDDIYTGEVGVRAKFNTGPVEHNLVASGVAYHAKSKNAYALSDFGNPLLSNLYNPVQLPIPPNNFFTGGNLADPRLTSRVKTASGAVADMMGFFDRRVLLTVGARYQKLSSFGYDYGTEVHSSTYEKHKISPVGGLLFKVLPSVSLYANYIEGLAQGDIAPAFSGSTPVTNAGQIFEPYVSRQKEAGVKFDGGRIGGAVSVYWTSKPQASVDTTTGIYSVRDKQKNRGVDISVFGEPLRGFKVLGGASFIDATVQGNDAIGTPHAQYNLGLEYAIPFVDGLSIDGRGTHTSAQYADAANRQVVPSWTRFDLGARYVFDIGKQSVTLRARVENLTNQNHWVSVGGFPGAGYLVLGAPRTYMLSGTVGF